MNVKKNNVMALHSQNGWDEHSDLHCVVSFQDQEAPALEKNQKKDTWEICIPSNKKNPQSKLGVYMYIYIYTCIYLLCLVLYVFSMNLM